MSTFPDDTNWAKEEWGDKLADEITSYAGSEKLADWLDDYNTCGHTWPSKHDPAGVWCCSRPPGHPHPHIAALDGWICSVKVPKVQWEAE